MVNILNPRKLSQIAPAVNPPVATDQFVGVAGGTTDELFTTSQLATALGQHVRTQLTANTNFYVSTTGSDSNNGLTALTPWATLQHADDTIALLYDLFGWNATINIAPGTYVGVENTTGYFSSVSTRDPSATNCVILYEGNAGTPTNVKITPTVKRQIGYGVFVGTFGPQVGAVLEGLDFVENNDSAVWAENFYGASFATVSAAVQNCQFDASGNGVPLVSGNVSFGGNITINGAAAGFGVNSTGIMNDGNETDVVAIFFQDANVTILGNPKLPNLIDQIQTSACSMSGGGKFTGAYQGNPFRCTGHSRLTSPFVTWSHPNFGSPTGKPIIADGGLFTVVTGTVGLEATGGQLIAISRNYSQPVTGFTLTLGQYDGTVIIDPAGTLATGTIVMASPVIDQQRVSIRTSQAITALTINPGAGQSVVGAPTTLAVGGIIDGLYRDANTTWYF